MRARKIDDSKLLALLKEGKLQKDIAREFKVSEPAITKRLRKLFPEKYQMPDEFKNLTVREKKFVLAKAQGKSNADAVIDAGYNVVDRRSAKSLGTRLMAKEEVRISIDAALNQVGLTRLYRAQKLRQFVDSIDPVIGLKALDMSMKAGGDYESNSSESKKPIIYISAQKLAILDEAQRLIEEYEKSQQIKPKEIRAAQDIDEAQELNPKTSMTQ
uniref:Uncharacterized protein n=1 Tax=candidate division WOR-3 bacterium TaxID=2052148 RepID=A0A7V3KMK4_UNCW3